jgi:hypothetical protein
MCLPKSGSRPGGIGPANVPPARGRGKSSLFFGPAPAPHQPGAERPIQARRYGLGEQLRGIHAPLQPAQPVHRHWYYDVGQPGLPAEGNPLGQEPAGRQRQRFTARLLHAQHQVAHRAAISTQGDRATVGHRVADAPRAAVRTGSHGRRDRTSTAGTRTRQSADQRTVARPAELSLARPELQPAQKTVGRKQQFGHGPGCRGQQAATRPGQRRGRVRASQAQHPGCDSYHDRTRASRAAHRRGSS